MTDYKELAIEMQDEGDERPIDVIMADLMSGDMDRLVDEEKDKLSEQG